MKAIKERGKANLGDKTMIDALEPAVEALRAQANRSGSLLEGLKEAEKSARIGMENTKTYIAKFGRAKSLGERAVGHQEFGSYSGPCWNGWKTNSCVGDTAGGSLMNKYAVAKVADLLEKKRRIVEVKGVEVGIFVVDGRFYAWRNFCPHAAARVCAGTVCGTRLPSMVYEYEYGRDQEILRCPWHGWEFDLKTGRHLVDPKVRLRGISVEQDGEDLYLIFP